MTRAQGSFVRLDIPTKRYDVLMTGMRNAVGYTFNLLGEMFYFDSDMEPEIGTPWYRPVRSAHGVPNADYGFRYGSNKFPADYFDTLPAMRNDGRGSPTGVVSYQAWAYPAEWRDVPVRGGLVARPHPLQQAHAERRHLQDADGSRGIRPWRSAAGQRHGGRTGRDAVLHDRRQRGRRRSLPRALRRTDAGAEAGHDGIHAVTRQAQPLSSWGYAAIEHRRRPWARASRASSSAWRAAAPSRAKTVSARCSSAAAWRTAQRRAAARAGSRSR